MFNRSLLLAFALVASLPIAAQTIVSPTWIDYPAFYAPGAAGIQILDLDGDGQNEAIITGGTGYAFSLSGTVFLARMREQAGSLAVDLIVPLAASESFASPIRVLPATLTQPAKILAVLDGPTGRHVVTFSGATLSRSTLFSVDPSFKVTDLADVDGDGNWELIGVIARSVAVIDLATGTASVDTSHKGDTVVAAQLDNDTALELIVGSAVRGEPGYILDGATGSQEWSYFGGFYGRPLAGNFDGDAATREFAILEPWGKTTIFTATPFYSPVSDFATGQVSQYLAYDVDADGVDELVVGMGQWGDVMAYDSRAWTVDVTKRNPGHGVQGLAVGQLDGDRSPEIIFGAGLTSSGADILEVFDAASLAIQYSRIDEAGPYSSVLVADLDQDGADEAVYASLYGNSEYDGHTLQILDVASGTPLRCMRDALDPWGDNYGAQLLAANLDNDPQLEIIIASGASYSPAVRVIDGLSFEEQWFYIPEDHSKAVTALALIPRTGDVPIVAATFDGRVVLIDTWDGREIWRSPSVGQSGVLNSLVIGNVDGDPADEILLVTASGIIAFDAEQRLLLWQLPIAGGALAVAIEGEGADCRVIAMEATRLARYDCASRQLASTRSYALPTADFGRMVTDSHGKLVLTDGQRIYLQTGRSIRVQSDIRGPALGWNSRGAVIASGEGVYVVIGGALSVQRFELNDPVLFSNSFE